MKWFDESSPEVIKDMIEAYGRFLRPLVLPPHFAKIAREVGADPSLWIEQAPLVPIKFERRPSDYGFADVEISINGQPLTHDNQWKEAQHGKN